MDTQSLINTALGAFLTLIGWLGKQLWDAVKRLQEDIRNIEKDLPKNYVSREDYKDTLKHIEDMFQRIYDKLDDKADKRSSQ